MGSGDGGGGGGDKDGAWFEDLYHRHYDDVLRYGYRRLDDRDEAEELTQETTGTVLAYEMTLLVNPGALNELRYPAVVSYTTYLEARQVDQVPG